MVCPDTAPFAEFSRVAGVDAPAFVERFQSTKLLPSGTRVSPGLTLRPSLSDGRETLRRVVACDVSPGLTLRPSLSGGIARADGVAPGRVSPGLTLRPSLSAFDLLKLAVQGNVSPGLTLRPSLSAGVPAGDLSRSLRCRRG